MTNTPDQDQQRDGRSSDEDKHQEQEIPQSQIDIHAEPTFFGYSRSELLARYPQLHSLPLKTRIRKMAQYAFIDREWELFMQESERRYGS